MISGVAIAIPCGLMMDDTILWNARLDHMSETNMVKLYARRLLITFNLNKKLRDFYGIFWHKLSYSYASYHILSAYSSLYTIHVKSLKIYYSKGNHA